MLALEYCSLLVHLLVPCTMYMYIVHSTCVLASCLSLCFAPSSFIYILILISAHRKESIHYMIHIHT